jgi:hypothetical protein
MGETKARPERCAIGSQACVLVVCYRHVGAAVTDECSACKPEAVRASLLGVTGSGCAQAEEGGR